MSVTLLLCRCFFVSLLLFRTFHCLEVHNITSSAPLFANQTLVSSNEIFELGFFTPNATTGNQYVGIWYKSIFPRTILWVANREKSVMPTEELASLRIGTDGNLKLVDGQQKTIWSTNTTVNSNNFDAVLLDDGNLVLEDTYSSIVAWESFHYPSDTIIPGMKVGINVRTGDKRYLVSWKSETDPSPGNFIFGITPERPPQGTVWKGSYPYWRGGQWDKTKFVGIEDMDRQFTSTFSLLQDSKQETYLFMTEGQEETLPTMFIFSKGKITFPTLSISSTGILKLNYWHNLVKEWLTIWIAPSNHCNIYGACGPFGICKAFNSPMCSCLTGFVPKSYEEWNKGNWTGGCIRQSTLNCQRSTSTSSSKDKFLKMSQMKLPDLANYIPYIIDGLECQNRCLDNCSCQAYSFIDSIGCMTWMEPLMDMEKFNSSGQDLFIRLAHIDSGEAKPAKILIIILPAVAAVFIMGVVIYCLCKHGANWKSFFDSGNMTDKKGESQRQKILREQLMHENESELPLFSLDSILAATENFNVTQKLGQGGFGPVYRGKLEDGRDIAIKRLSSSSVQGIEEFKNEIILISKLQHRNLIKLVGCCIEGDEKIIVYEYLPNKSLDTFLFDAARKTELNWDKRFNIIQGIARGLTYLHSDSCLRVIHRDLKASNILLDQKMSPKISDFGLARMFKGTQVLVNTHRVVGTVGYMSPEYAMGGIFSEKSDVYSFGVLILEIVTGKKNSLVHSNQNLISYAWQLWSQGEGLELVDELLVGKSSMSEVMKCIHIGLLCVQDHATDRPNMSTVVLMLSGESNLPQPKQPTFTSQNSSNKEILSHEESIQPSNTKTNSLFEGR